MSAFDPRSPRLKPALGKRPLGAVWFTLGSVVLLEVAARHRPDAVVIDMQHGLFDRLSLEAAVASAGAPTLVRTRDDAPASIGEALDAGAEGVIVPLVESATAAQAVASACRYPPDGTRSGGGIRPLADFGAHSAHANGGIVAGVMIETASGVTHAAEIARSGVDLVFVGTGDLALSLGTEPGSAAHAEACTAVLTACREAKVPCGVFAMDGASAAARIRQGFDLAVAAIDLNAFEAAIRSETSTFRAEASPPAKTTANRPARKRPKKRNDADDG
ncbi:MAG: aldolase/citrate lyase family protein [Pseudomonadota bacterium]